MARKLKSDRALFIATLLLVGLSLVMVYSASAVVAMERFGRPYFYLT
jgi:cell division protein FtsW